MKPAPAAYYFPMLLGAGVFLAAFVALAVRASGPNELPIDVRFLAWLQTQSWPVLRPLGTATNWLFDGLPVSIMLSVGVVTLVLRNRRAEALLLIIVAILKPVNGLLKNIVESPRPGPEFIQGSDPSSGWGFPSGHTASAVLLCGFAAWMISRRQIRPVARAGIWALATLIVIVTGFGRLWVGAHWPSDVLGAVLWTSAALIVLIGVFPQITQLAEFR